MISVRPGVLPKELTADFIKKWIVLYYMEIASYGNSK